MKAIVRGFCLSLLLCACVWADVPIIEEGAAQHISESEPWRIEPFNADAVYDKVQLDNSTTTHPHASRGWADPSEHGGSMLDLVGNGYREPINVIISGQSDRSVLSEQGLLDYVRSIGFSFECLHIHLGGLQHANLGDGNGYVPQLFEYRSLLLHKGAPGAWIGACWESLAGGNHFRGTSCPLGYTHSHRSMAPEWDVSEHWGMVPRRVTGRRCDTETHHFAQWLRSRP